MHVTRRDFVRTGAAVAGLSALPVVASADEAAEVPAAPAASKPQASYIAADVLIVGAGAAGVEAAINAASAGASVVIVDKKAWGHCGDSGLHYSGRMTTSAFQVEGDSPEVQLEDACNIGSYIVDQDYGIEVMQAYSDDKVTLKDENYGTVHFREAVSGKPYFEYSVSRPRLWCGYKLNPPAYKAKELGVNVLDYVTVTKLLTDADGAVAGATAVDFKTGAFYVIRAKATILCTGGDAGLWGAGTVAAKFGGGVEILTGDGHALAAPLGVEFHDLEFRAIYSSFGVLNPSGISNLACLYSSAWDQWTDAEGNTPLAPIVESGEGVSLRTAVAEWYRTQLAGKGTPFGGMYAPIDTPLIALAGMAGSVGSLGHFADMWEQLKVTYANQGNDLSHAEVGPHLTYDYGGIVTDIQGATGVDGLFAAGECAMMTGANYGVFRMFSTCQVMGKRSGQAAAAYAASVELAPIDPAVVEAECARVYGMFDNDPAEPIRVHEMKHRIQDSAWKGSGALRSDAWCQEALAELDQEKAELANVVLVDKSLICNTEWFEALELANMIEMAKMDTLASQARTESRGTHLRAEYPEMDNDNWCKNVIVKMVDGQYQVEIRDTPQTFFPPTPGKVDMGGGIVEGM